MSALMERQELSLLAREKVTMRTRRGLAAYLAKVWAIFAKEVQAELRSREITSTMVAFGALAVIVLGLAFDLRVPESRMVAPGGLWLVILFAGVLGLHRSFGAEVDKGSMAALLLAPMDRSVIYFGKLAANLLFMLVMELLILPLFLILFDISLFRLWILAGVFLGTFGYVSVGTLFAALTANVRARETMLPILFLPVMIPVFMAGVGLTAGILDGQPMSGLWRWLQLMLVFDVIVITVAFMVFDLIWERG